MVQVFLWFSLVYLLVVCYLIITHPEKGFIILKKIIPMSAEDDSKIALTGSIVAFGLFSMLFFVLSVIENVLLLL